MICQLGIHAQLERVIFLPFFYMEVSSRDAIFIAVFLSAPFFLPFARILPKTITHRRRQEQLRAAMDLEWTMVARSTWLFAPIATDPKGVTRTIVRRMWSGFGLFAQCQFRHFIHVETFCIAGYDRKRLIIAISSYFAPNKTRWREPGSGFPRETDARGEPWASSFPS